MLRFENDDPMNIPVTLPVRSEDAGFIKELLSQNWDGIVDTLSRWFEALDMRKDIEASLELIPDVTQDLELLKFRQRNRTDEVKAPQKSAQQKKEKKQAREQQLLDTRSVRTASKLNNTFHCLWKVAYEKNKGDGRHGVLPLTRADMVAFLKQEKMDLQKRAPAFNDSAKEAKRDRKSVV